MNPIVEYIKDKGGFISRQEIADDTIYTQLLKEVEKGNVMRLKAGVYALPEALAKPMVDMRKLVPDGVLCLYSAWFYYQLTTQVPVEYYVAVEKSRKIVLPDYPPIRLCYWNQATYSIGIKEEVISEHQCLIYDMEKSVCDAIKFRNKIGMDVCSEIVRNYMKRPERNLNKLAEYAKILRVGKTLQSIVQFVI